MSRWSGLAALVLVMAGLNVVIGPAAADGESSRLVGFRIGPGPSAADAWMGSYRVGTSTGYRFQPGKHDTATRYRAARLVRQLGGSGRSAARRTHRLSYVLAEFGGRRNPIQAAAVDAAVLALVRAGRFGLNRSVGARRIRDVGPYAPWVRSYATQILALSKRYAGPYRVRVRAGDSSVGATTTVTVSVRSRLGRPLGGRRVTVRAAGNRWTGRTSDRGRVVAYLPTGVAGPATARVRVQGLPTAGVMRRPAIRSRASGVLLADRFAALHRHARFAVSGVRAVTVTATSSDARTPSTLSGTFEVTGGAGQTTATIGLLGPSDSPGDCGSEATRTWQVQVAAGVYQLPSVLADQSGYYRWSVALSGNEYAEPTSACADPVAVRTQAALSQARPDGRSQTVSAGEAFRIVVATSGFDRSEAHTVRSAIFGPFKTADNARCVAAREVVGRAQSVAVDANTTVRQRQVVLGEPGWYVWRSTLSDGALVAGTTSNCGARYRVVAP
ncbi:hypothetical protein BH09ACT11_BH09ACT11_08670 [soil metagenome]